MNSKLTASILVEIIKLVKNKINYIYILFAIIAVLSSVVGMEILDGHSNRGYSYLLLSLQLLATSILPILLLIFASTIISTEISSKTVRNILVSNPSRNHFLVSKITASLIFQLTLMTIAAITGIIFGHLLFGFGDIVEDGFLIMKQHRFWITFIMSYGLLFLSLLPAISLGIFISIISKNIISSIVISIGSYILLEAIKVKLHIENYIYSTYIGFPLSTLEELVEGFTSSWTPKLYNFLIVDFPWISVPIILSFLVINRQEYK